MAMRRSASEPISQIAIAIMSAANATGSAWKLPPDSASPLSAKISGLSETPLASVASVAAAWRSEVEHRAHHLRLAAQAVGVLHAVVVDEVRGADGAAGHQRAQGGGDLDLAAMAAQRVDARVERRVGALGRVGRERAGDERRAEHPLGLEQAGQRIGGRELRAVEQREPFLRARARAARARRAASASAAGRRLAARAGASPTPIIAAAMCASGARSPEAPTEPWPGSPARGRAPAWLPARRRCAAARRRRPGRGSRASAPSSAARSARGIGSPTPAACDSTMLRCSVARSAGPMRTLASLPKPVLMP